MKMSRAYQRCNRLNQKVRQYIGDYESTKVFPLPPTVPASVRDFREDDEKRLELAIHEIDDANTSISVYLETGEVWESPAERAAKWIQTAESFQRSKQDQEA